MSGPRKAGGRLLQDRKFQIIGGHKQAAFGDSLRGGAAKFRGKFVTGRASADYGLKSLEHLAHLLARFMHKFQTEMADSGLFPRVQVAAGFLGLRAENSVAATHVGQHGMRPAFGVLELDAMLFARAAAVAIAGTLRQETAEDAVLGVKHRQMLIGDSLDIPGADTERKSRDLRGVQIVGRSHTIEAEIQEQFGADGVGHVETKVAD